MMVTYFDREIETASRENLELHQTARMQTLLKHVLASNPFYGKKLRDAGITDARDFKSVDDVRLLPFTRKQELVDDQAADLLRVFLRPVLRGGGGVGRLGEDWGTHHDRWRAGFRSTVTEPR